MELEKTCFSKTVVSASPHGVRTHKTNIGTPVWLRVLVLICIYRTYKYQTEQYLELNPVLFIKDYHNETGLKLQMP